MPFRRFVAIPISKASTVLKMCERSLRSFRESLTQNCAAPRTSHNTPIRWE